MSMHTTLKLLGLGRRLRSIFKTTSTVDAVTHVEISKVTSGISEVTILISRAKGKGEGVKGI
jgi:hypothetical protein